MAIYSPVNVRLCAHKRLFIARPHPMLLSSRLSLLFTAHRLIVTVRIHPDRA